MSDTNDALFRAKVYIRCEGWTIRGNRRTGYVVTQLGQVRRMNEAALLAFAGIVKVP